jgi:hypothetical protein
METTHASERERDHVVGKEEEKDKTESSSFSFVLI